MYDAPIVFFLIVTLFVEIRSHCQIKCMQYASMGAFKCPAFDACCRCAFTDERLVVFLLISIPEMGQCTSASGCVFVFFPAVVPATTLCLSSVHYVLLVFIFLCCIHILCRRDCIRYMHHSLFITVPVIRHQNAEQCDFFMCK